MLTIETIDSPIGRVHFALEGDALAALGFDEQWGELTQRLDLAGATRPRERSKAARAIEGYFAGDVRGVQALAVAPRGTEFQRRVWRALVEVPAGQTRSYADIGARVGCKSARAVGSANARNPISIVVPCHRVVRSEGTLGGYAGGLDRKRWLLDHEERHAS